MKICVLTGLLAAKAVQAMHTDNLERLLTPKAEPEANPEPTEDDEHFDDHFAWWGHSVAALAKIYSKNQKLCPDILPPSMPGSTKPTTAVAMITGRKGPATL